MAEPVIVAASRTAIGTFGGALKDVEAHRLAARIINSLMVQTGASPDQLDEVIMGSIYQGGTGPNVARQAAVAAGVPYEVPSMTINKMCGSGLKAIGLAAQAVRLDEAAAIVAGGMENMSRAPYVVANARWGQRLGNGELIDVLLLDGLWDCFYDCHMGMTAENLAEEYGIGREEQDRFAIRSQERYHAALARGAFDAEIAPVDVPQRKGDSFTFSVDEHPRKDTSLESLSQLKPAFKENGSVTAGNASGINDGAAAVLVMSRELAGSCGLPPMAHIRATAQAGVDPKVMGIGPAPAIRKLLDKSGMKLDDIGLIELNEAFAAQSLAVGRELDWDETRVNVNGGAIALGHPVGASGARIAVTLLHEMNRRQCQWGIASLCIGGGMGIAMLLERS